MSSTQSRLHKAFGIDASFHGDNTGIKLDKSIQLQVICLGLSRTGTTSLQAAFVRLGLHPSHQGIDLFRSPPRLEAFISLDEKLLSGTWKAGDPDLTARLRELMSGYRSSTDNPINTYSDEIYAAFPNAKYILTTRPDGKNGWWKSIMDAASWHFRRDLARWAFRSLIWPVRFLRRTDDKNQIQQALRVKKYGVDGPDIYTRHNAHVQAVIPKDKLLVYDVREGWEPLCRFLELPIPDEPFPKLNETSAMQAIYVGMMAFGAFTWSVYIGSITALGYLALNPDVAKGLVNSAVGFVSGLSTPLTCRKHI